MYINFSPYENAGNILTYILDRFSTVLVFSFQFHKLGDNRHTDRLIIYRNKRVVMQYHLLRAPVTTSLTFFLLPVRSVIIFIQIIFYLIKLKNTFGPYHVYFTVNAFTAWTGNHLRALGLVKRTIFWIWDYYPPTHPSLIVRLMRWLYWFFDKPASLNADRTVFLNERLLSLRKKLDIVPKTKSFPVVPIGTDPIKTIPRRSHKTLRLAFFGVQKQSQGLDLFFRNAQTLMRHNKGLELHVIGEGPDTHYFKNQSKTLQVRAYYYGFVQNDTTIRDILSRCHIGLATYVPDKSNVSYYSDPSKIKLYLSIGMPVITTNVFTFSKEIAKHRAGIIIQYYKSNDFITAVQTILRNYDTYCSNALALGKKYHYKKIYPAIFSDI